MRNFECDLPYSQIKRHNYYGVELYLSFADKKAHDTYLECVEYKKKPLVAPGFPYDERYELYNYLMPSGQKVFLGKNKLGRDDIFKLPRDKRREYLFRDKYFLKSIDYVSNKNFKGLNITLYIKPSSSITQSLRQIKREARKWYGVIVFSGYKNPFHPKANKGAFPVKMDKPPFLDHANKGEYFKVFQIQEDNGQSTLKAA